MLRTLVEKKFLSRTHIPNNVKELISVISSQPVVQAFASFVSTYVNEHVVHTFDLNTQDTINRACIVLGLDSFNISILHTSTLSIEAHDSMIDIVRPSVSFKNCAWYIRKYVVDNDDDDDDDE